MITIAYWFVLKIPNIYPLDVWAVFLSSVLLDNKIFQVAFFFYLREKLTCQIGWHPLW